MLNFYPPFLCRVLEAILKMADILKILRIAPLMVTYHYVKFYVSIIIQLQVCTLKNMDLTPFTTNPKTFGSTRNIYL
jgi:hypothetical protein